MTEEPRPGELSMAQRIRVALVGTWVAVVLFLAFTVYMVLRAADEPATDGRDVVGFAVLFGGFALLGLGVAIPYTRHLLRLLRQSDET